MKNYTVEVAIPALNEEQNIKQLIESLLSQNQTGFKLTAITVYSDGSDDQTVAIVKSFTDKRVRVVAGKKRIGQSRRLNQAFRRAQADIIVLLDADILPTDKNHLANLIRPIIKKKNVGVVGGNAQALPPETFVESALYTMFKAREIFKQIKHNGHNVYGLWGCCMALSRDFYKDLTLPKETPGDAYTYFTCITRGFKFRHEPKAKVWFRSPQNMQDHIKQGIRFNRSGDTLKKFFDNKLIAAEYTVPFGTHVYSLVMQVIHNPLGYLLLKYMHFQIIKASVKEYQPLWDQVLSTKHVTIHQA